MTKKEMVSKEKMVSLLHTCLWHIHREICRRWTDMQLGIQERFLHLETIALGIISEESYWSCGKE